MVAVDEHEVDRLGPSPPGLLAALDVPAQRRPPRSSTARSTTRRVGPGGAAPAGRQPAAVDERVDQVQDGVDRQGAREYERGRALVDADLDRPPRRGELREQSASGCVCISRGGIRPEPTASARRRTSWRIGSGVRTADGLGERHGAAVNLPGLSARVDVALLSLGTTLGLRHADDALAELLADAG